MDKLVVLAYDLAAVLIILMTIAYSTQRGFATRSCPSDRSAGSLFWRGIPVQMGLGNHL